MPRPSPIAEQSEPADHESRASLEGIVERVTFHSEESGYSVLRLSVRGQAEPVTVVGGFPNPNPGETLLLFGRWTQHPKFGPQFQADRFQVKQPASAYAIEKYLGSGLIKGVGPVMAKRLVAQFGEETLRVIEEEPGRLVEAEGIGPKRIEMIKRAWAEQKEIQNIMLFLQGHGVSSTYAVKIYKAYGDESVEKVNENPYRLADDIWGIGFKTADKIAQALGVQADDPSRLKAGVLYTLSQAQDAGHCYLVKEAASEYAAQLLSVEPETMAQPEADLVEEEKAVVEVLEDGSEALFHPALYHTEVGIATALAHFLKGEVRDDLTPERAVLGVEKIAERAGLELSDEQKNAVVMGLLNRVLVITGGPGVGKTTTTRTLVEALRFRRRKVLLASPTGRAAKRLSEVVGAEAKTIHRLLAFDPSTFGFKHNLENRLDLDVLVVDEASMLDTILFYQLLKALPEHAQLILVGDVDQLPSVGAGNVLRDLIESEVVPVARLTQVFRQAEASQIIGNAHRINRGEMPLLVPPSPRNDSDCVFVEVEEPEAIAQMIATLVSRSLPRLGFSPQETQVLCPMNRGEVGAGNLNRILQEHLNPPRSNVAEVARLGRLFRVGDRVIQLHNNYDKEVFNGDIGEIASINMEDQKLLVAYPESRISYEFSELDELQLAYALSVHKCIHEDERVWTWERGLVSIRNLIPGEKVLTGSHKPGRVLNKIATGRKPVVRVVTRSGYSIQVSEDHPLLVATREQSPHYLNANELTPSHFACLSRAAVTHGNSPGLPPIAFPHTMEQTRWRCKENANVTVPAQIDEDLAWLLGCLVGDGSYRDQRDGTIDLTNMDDCILEGFRRILTSYGLRVGTYRKAGRAATRLYVVSKPFRKWLLDIGLDHTIASAKHVPSVIFRSPAPARAAFLRGLFDTDGSVGIGTCRLCRLTTASRRLADEVQELLLSLGVASMIRPSGPAAWHVTISGTSLGLFYSSVGFSVPYKQERLQLLLGENVGKTNHDTVPFGPLIIDEIVRTLGCHFGASRGIPGKGIYAYRERRYGRIISKVRTGKIQLSYHHLAELSSYLTSIGVEMPWLIAREIALHYLYDPIVQVDRLEETATMYDIEVEGLHSFISNGFICHNSQGSEYRAIVVPMHTQHFPMLARNLLYTALTRAKKMAVLVGTKKAVGMAVRNGRVSQRNTRLKARLREALGNK